MYFIYGGVMKHNAGLFIGIVVTVIVIGGIALAADKSKDKTGTNAEPNTTVASDSTPDSGNVKGATTEDDTNVSDDYKEKLAKFLTEKGAVFYGAYWCPHCKDQKKLFGDALKFVNYVECDAAGDNAKPDECRAQGVEGYPTWIYQGKKYSGTRTLAELAEMVGFTNDAKTDLSPAEGSDTETSGGTNDDDGTPVDDSGSQAGDNQ